MSRVPLADAIADLRAELARAHAAGRGEAVLFDVGPVELELAIELAATASAKAETKWWVVSGGVEATGERSVTHRLTLTLTPRTAAGRADGAT